MEVTVVARCEDLELLRAVARAPGDPPGLPPLERPTLWWAAWVGGRVVARASLVQMGRRSWRLRGCLVDSEHRGRGLGERLVLARIAHAIAEGADRVDAHAARPDLFEDMGFERRAEHPGVGTCHVVWERRRA